MMQGDVGPAPVVPIVEPVEVKARPVWLGGIVLGRQRWKRIRPPKG